MSGTAQFLLPGDPYLPTDPYRVATKLVDVAATVHIGGARCEVRGDQESPW